MEIDQSYTNSHVQIVIDALKDSYEERNRIEFLINNLNKQLPRPFSSTTDAEIILNESLKLINENNGIIKSFSEQKEKLKELTLLNTDLNKKILEKDIQITKFNKIISNLNEKLSKLLELNS